MSQGFAPHTHNSVGANVQITGATIAGCPGCQEDVLISRLAAYVRQWNPYKPGSVNPYRLADLLERKAGPDDHHRDRMGRNEREWFLGDRLQLYVLWGVNWAIGAQFWIGRDNGVLDFDLGPTRVNFYFRWGLTEDERMSKWLRHR